MKLTTQRREVPLGEGTLIFETGKMARQAGGSTLVRLGDTVVLVTATMDTGRTNPYFLPLTIDYREATYAGGRIPGGFFKREGRPSEKEIITSRMIDRPLRPLFPEGYRYETQVIGLVLSADGENDPDILAINGASAALALSEIPFFEELGAVRVGMIEGEMIFNPTNSQRDVSDLDLVVAGTEHAIVMVESGANQLSEETMLDCIWSAHREIQKLIAAQRELAREKGVVKPEWTAPERFPRDLYERIKADVWEPLWAALHTVEKFARREAVRTVRDGYLDQNFPADAPEADAAQRGLRDGAKKVFSALEEEALREAVLKNRRRFDGRALDEIRGITIEIGTLPRTHGSALFTRGETQALVTATLGTSRDAQIIEEYEGETLQKFLLHYNFPPFSVGEVKFLRGPGRREIGHGVLARRALTPLLPHEDDFPYTVRVVSDILESNGSSSMATVCGGSLALFDAGVPMLSPVAGVAMGLIQSGDDFAVLSDIAGQEDHYGDMDFKVAGTADGITALQMDIKIGGVTRAIMGHALEQARHGRLHILEKMAEVLGEPRSGLSRFAPRLYTLQVPKDKIRDVIGPGGKTIRSITEETGCQIEIKDDGTVIVASPDEMAAKRAIEIIERLTETPEVGKVYTGPVRRVEAYGAFVELMPGTDGLVHISELAPYRVRETTDIAHEGDEMTVKVISIDEQGKVRLSRKAVIMESPDYDPAQYEGMGEEVPVGAGAGGGDRDRGGDRGRGGAGGRDRGRGGRGGGGGGRGGFGGGGRGGGGGRSGGGGGRY
ncbi:MAG TPA: polyribonucleotide nucleotidyltransferase [Thermoanaerobaculia bacterium]|nr:polyribonucleotide nucleotidyltransferase [Thermoanaerobaculia bacterium]